MSDCGFGQGGVSPIKKMEWRECSSVFRWITLLSLHRKVHPVSWTLNSTETMHFFILAVEYWIGSSSFWGYLSVCGSLTNQFTCGLWTLVMVLSQQVPTLGWEQVTAPSILGVCSWVREEWSRRLTDGLVQLQQWCRHCTSLYRLLQAPVT